MKKAAVNTSVRVIWWTYTFIPLGQIPGGKLLGHMLCIFHFIRGSQTLFQSNCTILHSHLQRMVFQSLCVIYCYLTVVLICISVMQMIGSFCQLICNSYFFWTSIHSNLLTFLLGSLFLKLRLGIPYLLQIQFLYQICIFSIFSISLCLICSMF